MREAFSSDIYSKGSTEGLILGLLGGNGNADSSGIASV